jgi:6-phosphogluconolactonase
MITSIIETWTQPMSILSRNFIFSTGLAMIVMMGTLASPPASAKEHNSNYFLYAGTYGKGIYAYHFDAGDGRLEPIGLAAQIVNPSWVTVGPHDRFLYAVSEVEGKANGAVAAFAIDRRTGALHELNSMSSGGVAPCYLATDHTRKMLLVANYGTGGVGVFAIKPDGSLGTMTALLTEQGHSVNPTRQEGPHAHEAVISADNRFAYVPDLGLDKIRIYRLDPEHAAATPNDPPFAKEDPGMGPRHIAFAPGDKRAYVVSELKSFVTVFSRDPQNGSMTAIQKVSTLPEGFSGENAPAEIVVDRAGKFVYATNRGANTIAVFAIDQPTGTLRMIQSISSEGNFPRGFTLDPTGRFAFAGNQKSGGFAMYRVDPATGRLTFTGKKVDVSSPIGFAFVAAE